MQYMNVRLAEMLELDKDQIERIRAINRAYQSELSNLEDENHRPAKARISQLLRERNSEIIEVLNERQRKVLYTCSMDLISF